MLCIKWNKQNCVELEIGFYILFYCRVSRLREARSWLSFLVAVEGGQLITGPCRMCGPHLARIIHSPFAWVPGSSFRLPPFAFVLLRRRLILRKTRSGYKDCDSVCGLPFLFLAFCVFFFCGFWKGRWDWGRTRTWSSQDICSCSD